MSGQLTLDQLLALIDDMIYGGKVGTLFVTTSDNHSIIIAMRDGVITSLSCGMRRGLAAVPCIRQMESGTYRLDPGAPGQPTGGLASTHEILAALHGEETSPAPADSTEPSATAQTASFDGEEARETLCAVLRQFIGPIANVVCERTARQVGGMCSAADVERLLGRLAEEIPDAREAQQFVGQARSRLKGLLG